MFPKTEVQNCIIHQLRNSSKYVSYKDLKALMADLKAVYAAVDEYSGLRDTGVRGFGNRHSGSQKTMIPGMETIHTMP